jgi:hypothetical protein
LPANCWAIADLNHQIGAEFDLGTDVIGHRDHLWVVKPVAHILEYDKEHKAQWLMSVDLAQYCFMYQVKFAASSLSQQCKTMEAWLGQLTNTTSQEITRKLYVTFSFFIHGRIHLGTAAQQVLKSTKDTVIM